ncbi:MAG: hypothetical protein EOO13_06635 [Chitinophagaceae bacterium]|nr:MAG: hypothetical protein EOO13_06635 [Chitinophagaceae bacterium]
MKSRYTLLFLVLTILAFLSCQKSPADDNPQSLIAAGSLQHSGSGDCLPSSVQGNYIAGTPLSISSFINVTVNITDTGTYNINSNTLNGYGFSATGNATTLGIQTIRLTATGTPAAAGSNAFIIKFGSTQCSIVVNVLPAATPDAIISAVNCTGAVLAGTYQAGTPTTASNTLQLQVTITSPGAYNINTTLVNGVRFSGSGVLANGTHMVTLSANGGTPVTPGPFAYTVTAGSSTCSLNVFYASAPAPGGEFTWSFKVGTVQYSGACMVSEKIDSPASITVWGYHASGAEFSITVADRTPGAAIVAGVYPGVPAVTPGFPPTGPHTWSFYYSGGSPVYAYYTGYGNNLTTTVTQVNTVTKIIEGTFSGTVRQNNEATGPVVTISDGSFKAKIP